jgi:hypothetical protein
MTPRALGRLAALSAVAILVSCAHRPSGEGALPPGARRLVLEVRGHGQLLVTLPAGWRAAAVGVDGGPGPAQGEGPQSIRIEKPGDRFLVLLTPMWNPGEPEPPQARADTARLFAELGRRTALAGSVEREIPLEELEGGGAPGAYFSATDARLVERETGPGEFRHVLQGAAAIGPVILAFAILDDGPGPWREKALDLVRGARHLATGEPEASAPAELEPVAEDATTPLRLRWPGKGWEVLVDLPGFRVGLRPAAAGTPYAIGLHPETGVAASVSLTPAAGAKDAASCRERALAAIARAFPRLALGRADGPSVARAAYEVRDGKAGVPEAHAHTFLYRDGTCVHVHVSKAGPGPGDADRLEEVLSAVRVAEDF